MGTFFCKSISWYARIPPPPMPICTHHMHVCLITFRDQPSYPLVPRPLPWLQAHHLPQVSPRHPPFALVSSYLFTFISFFSCHILWHVDPFLFKFLYWIWARMVEDNIALSLRAAHELKGRWNPSPRRVPLESTTVIVVGQLGCKACGQ
jgi:hypothetical protein